MKVITFILLLGLSISYSTDAAVTYARKYCASYNPNYPNYIPIGGDSASFVSQCLIAGGQDFKGCINVKSKGIFEDIISLKNCLIQKGWKASTTRPPEFKAGYPMAAVGFNHIMIASSVKGDQIKFCSHSNDYCDKELTFKVIYYYL